MKVASRIERLIDAGGVVEWRPVKGFESYYEVNNEGDVKSLARLDSRGHLVKERILKPGKTTRGYLRVTLYKDCEKNSHAVHRLVGEAFIGECPDGYQVNHINENRVDNRLDNLEYVTPKQNSNHGTRNQKIARSNSISIESFDPITGETIRRYPSALEAERLDGYTSTNIIQCIKGRCKLHKGVGWRRSEV